MKQLGDICASVDTAALLFADTINQSLSLEQFSDS
jgi:hypothetical protein